MTAPPPVPAFLQGGGAMGQRILAFDWASHPLGPLQHWPGELRTALSLCLDSSFPTAIYWGPDLHILYNDAWAPIPAEKHPGILGLPAREGWADIWDIVGPQLEHVFATGEGLAQYEQMLPMVRGGQPRETWWNYSFTAIRQADHSVGGIFNQGNDITDVVHGRRALQAEEAALRLANWQLGEERARLAAVIEAEQRAQQALRRFNQTLEAHVTGRTAALTRALEAQNAVADRLRATFATDLIFQGFLDTQGTLLDANPASLAAIRCSLAEVVGRPFWDTPWFTATPGAAQRIREAVDAARGGQAVRNEMEVALPDGTRTFHFSLRPVFNARREVVGLVPEALETGQAKPVRLAA